jgi:hypothetical protein
MRLDQVGEEFNRVQSEIDCWRRTSENYRDVRASKMEIDDKIEALKQNERLTINSPAFYKLLTRRRKTVEMIAEELTERRRLKAEEKEVIASLKKQGDTWMQAPKDYSRGESEPELETRVPKDGFAKYAEFKKLYDPTES